MTTNFMKWFSITINNDFFNLKDVFTDCYMLPSNDTKQNFFTGSNWIQKFFENVLYVMVNTKDKKPLMNVDANKFFRFYLFTSNHNFYNYTDIDRRIGKGYVLYLSNFANNKTNNENPPPQYLFNLSASIKKYTDFSSGYVFTPGDLVADGNNIYECVYKPTATGLNNEAWLKLGTKQYISLADVLPLSSSTYRFNFGNSNNDDDNVIQFTATVRGFKVSGNTLAKYIALTTTQSFPQAVKEVQVDLSSLPAGRYEITLSAIKFSDNSTVSPDPIIFYYDIDITQNKALAVVEIFNCIAKGTDYSLQDGTDIINQINYTINFANRIAWWNYIFTTNAPGIHSTVGGINFTPEGALTFASSKPLPLVNHFTYNPFTVSGSSPTKEVPWPSPAALKCETETDGTIKKFFTETYINY